MRAMSEKPERATRAMSTASGCAHEDTIREVTPRSKGCADCVAVGSGWVHLRLCLACGYVGCCDDSPNQHARKHAAAAEHPIVQSFEPGEDWKWCYVDETFLI
jgi:hypothetical protein